MWGLNKATCSESLLQNGAHRKHFYCFCSMNVALGASRSLCWPTLRALRSAPLRLKHFSGADFSALQWELGGEDSLPVAQVWVGAVVSAVLYKGPWSLQRTSVCWAAVLCRAELSPPPLPPSEVHLGFPHFVRSSIWTGKTPLRSQRATSNSYMIELRNRKVWLFGLDIFLLIRH